MVAIYPNGQPHFKKELYLFLKCCIGHQSPAPTQSPDCHIESHLGRSIIVYQSPPCQNEICICGLVILTGPVVNPTST